MRAAGIFVALAATAATALAEAPIDLDDIVLEDEDGQPAVDAGPPEPAPAPGRRRRRHGAGPTPRRGTWHLRAGILHVTPHASSGAVVLSGVAGPASLAVENGPIAGSSTDLTSITTPALLVGYAVPAWEGELGVETVLAPPVTFELRAKGTIAEQSLAPMVLDTVPTGIPPLGPELGRTKALPPIVTVVYRARRGHRVRPYVGVGVSYFHAYDATITNPILTEVATPHLAIDDAVSAVGQLGLDVRVAGRVHATLDVKALSGYAIAARVDNIHVRTPAFPLYESVHVGAVSVDVVARPVLVTAGAGVNF